MENEKSMVVWVFALLIFLAYNRIFYHDISIQPICNLLSDPIKLFYARLHKIIPH